MCNEEISDQPDTIPEKQNPEKIQKPDIPQIMKVILNL